MIKISHVIGFGKTVQSGFGQKYVGIEMKEIIAATALGYGKEINTLNLLSKIERKIVVFLTKGFTSHEIAVMENVKMKTIILCRYKILKKLNLPNTALLVNYASKAGGQLKIK